MRKFAESLRGLVSFKDIDDLLSVKGKSEVEAILVSNGNRIDPSLLLPKSTNNASKTAQSATPMLSSDSQNAPSPASSTPFTAPSNLSQSRSLIVYASIGFLAIVVIVFIVIWMRKSP